MLSTRRRNYKFLHIVHQIELIKSIKKTVLLQIFVNFTNIFPFKQLKNIIIICIVFMFFMQAKFKQDKNILIFWQTNDEKQNKV